MRHRAEVIHSRPAKDVVDEQPTCMVLPNSTLADLIQHYVGTMVKIAVTSGTKIGDLITVKRPPHLMPDNDIYAIPCSVCDKS